METNFDNFLHTFGITNLQLNDEVQHLDSVFDIWKLNLTRRLY